LSIDSIYIEHKNCILVANTTPNQQASVYTDQQTSSLSHSVVLKKNCYGINLHRWIQHRTGGGVEAHLCDGCRWRLEVVVTGAGCGGGEVCAGAVKRHDGVRLGRFLDGAPCSSAVLQWRQRQRRRSGCVEEVPAQGRRRRRRGPNMAAAKRAQQDGGEGGLTRWLW
jgi:hypothetical protein